MKTLLTALPFIVIGLWCMLSGPSGGPIKVLASAFSAGHDKLGWMDEAELKDSDRHRIAKISGRGVSSNLDSIRLMQSGYSGGVTRRDFELLRQDRRRAQAAYPDVSGDKLYIGTWLTVSLSDKVPMEFCTSGNSNGTQGADGRDYLDGGCYISIVRPEFTKRADAATTKRVLGQLKDADYQKQLAHIRKWGYSTWSSGTGGSVSVSCYPDPLPSDQERTDTVIPGRCVVILDHDRYEFPFGASDWVKPPYSREGLEKLAVARGVVKTSYSPVQEKPWVRKDGMLARGEKCAAGRLCRSKWNGDGYDNSDIGPDTPASWVIENMFGTAFLPSPDNGEKRSDPHKPWYVVASYWGYQSQASGGWTEKEAKDALPKLMTSQSWGMQGQSQEEINRGNLREARATQIKPENVLMLVDKSLPSPPAKVPDPNMVPYSQGMTLMPGQSTSMSVP